MRDFVLLYLNGRRLEIRGPDAFAPLSTVLRQTLALTGTKVVCAEGDCGACAVLAGRPDGHHIAYRPVTSCIAFVHQFDAAHVVTVEGLRHGDALNPVQEAMVACHGAQCGYCTPGFVVAMCGAFEANPTTDPAALRAALVGNLCRCTGYESILAAGRAVDTAQLKRLDDLYPPAPILADLTARAAEEVLIESAGQRFFKPLTIDAAVKFKAANPACTVVAGATDLGVQVNKRLRACPVTMTLAAIPRLAEIDVTETRLVIGANVTLAQLEHATREHFPELHPMLLRHGSLLIRNAGTLAGNIANGSSIGDALPALFVLNADVELAGPAGARRVNLNDFYTGYKQSVLAPDELITAVRIPRLAPGDVLRLYKVSKRHDLDISTFTAAIFAQFDGDAIRHIRIAYGGVAPTVIRLPRTEAFLANTPFTPETIAAAARLARHEIAPISDVRGSADYRAQLAENILRKFHHDCAARLDPAPA
jgi:xanthine dehydrogenase small subunit